MRRLSKEQAEAVAEVTSSICCQGNSWVLKEWDMEKGAERLTRGLTHKAAIKKLKAWRREKTEQLLREEQEADAYIVRVWQPNPDWDGQGIWQFDDKCWYTSLVEAQKEVEKKKQDTEKLHQIYKIKTEEVPGSFKVA